MRTYRHVTGAGGTRLAVREAGPVGAPGVVFVHGWAQSGEVWADQFADEALTERYRLVAVDLRGHGDSDAPEDGYADAGVWADDLAAVLAEVGAPSVLVGWSYGGLVAVDYLRTHGAASVAGLVLVGAIIELGRGRAGGRVGAVMRAALPAALSEDPAEAVPALLGFTEGIAASPLPGERAQRLLGATLRVPPRVRSALFRREVDSADLLGSLDLPTLVLHGRLDAVVDPAAAEFAAGTIPGARLRWFDDVGHLPFVERPAEFNAAVAEFAAGCARTVVS
ncbi:alpha/beta hydrolase [Solihabitans fulvus]|uniref:Alpha/beta hydrolase n=1 Tax=Solihabitans fulvus TaxID=1892852 RepID=A0A5B2XM78_9PSEU|nr:alpha/beta hydrolase [Solihabitans fulvus]KAA2264877.1 alpha/beta hydrolase [Solihabitans fulvus]